MQTWLVSLAVVLCYALPNPLAPQDLTARADEVQGLEGLPTPSEENPVDPITGEAIGKDVKLWRPEKPFEYAPILESDSFEKSMHTLYGENPVQTKIWCTEHPEDQYCPPEFRSTSEEK